MATITGTTTKISESGTTYILETPITTTLTNEQILTYPKTTNINQDTTGVKCDLTATAKVCDI